MSSVESAVIDSMLKMKKQGATCPSKDETELVETTKDDYVPKLSSWVMRHLGTFGVTPSEQNASVSANVIVGLMDKLGCSVVHLFPTDRTTDIRRIDALFRTSNFPKESSAQ